MKDLIRLLIKQRWASQIVICASEQNRSVTHALNTESKLSGFVNSAMWWSYSPQERGYWNNIYLNCD